MDNNSTGEKEKKKGNTKFSLNTICTHSKWANEQTLKKGVKDCVHIVFEKNVVFTFFFLLLTRAVILYPFTKIPVPID